MSNWKGKRVLISGVCGTVGKELLNQLLIKNVSQIVGFDHNENALFFLTQKYASSSNVKLVLGDIRDRYEVKKLMEGIDIVLHTAALKHVEMCELAPRDAVKSNITGTQNIIDAAIECKVERVLFTSTDKAVNPTNVMGTTKLMAERLVTAAQMQSWGTDTKFFSTRFGNVLGSDGSVIQLFRQQITSGQSVTLTHPDMTRFIMSLSDAVNLVMESVFLACGGEVFVMKMSAVNIIDIAEVMIEELSVKDAKVGIKQIGIKPGEKMYEELLSSEEVRRTIELENYYVVKPAFSKIYNKLSYEYKDIISETISTPYTSNNQRSLNKEELRAFLKNNLLLVN
jgi:FlaA1/EpsC-like NDP-sugar epimerase